jgi:Spy/CpxP family protein refolding chaperone
MRIREVAILTAVISVVGGVFVTAQEQDHRHGQERPQMERGKAGGPGGPDGQRMQGQNQGNTLVRESMMMHMLMNPRMAEEMGLEEEQITKIRATITDIRKREIQLRADQEIAGMDQVNLLTAETVDEEAVMAAVEKSGRIHTELAKLRIKPILELKKILTREQLEKAKGIVQERRMRDRFRRGGGEERRGKGPGGDREKEGRERGKERRREHEPREERDEGGGERDEEREGE